MRWKIAKEISQKEELSKIVDLMLENRGLLTEEAKKDFIQVPKIESLLKKLPEEFHENLKKARKIILAALKKRIPIIIHGDYDSDGICATAILYTTLKSELNHKKTYAFIPDRFEHGYGLSTSSIDACVKNLKNEVGDFNEAILITVDTGITSVQEVMYAKSLGFTVILTDHHQKPDPVPNPDVLLWSNLVVGSGVAWLLSRALGSENSQNLGLVALATVTDLQPLLGINRTLVKEGLEILNANPPTGIKALLAVAGKSSSNLSTYDLGWVLGPRLNATGRIGSAEDALLLLIEQDEQLIAKHATKLNQLNISRQEKTSEMYDIAASFEADLKSRILFSSSSEYHEGIIGLVAAKLAQKYNKPAVVVSVNKDICKGSVRSVAGVDIISILRKAPDLFVNLGGHPMAAGFSVREDKLKELEDTLYKLGRQFISDEDLIPLLDIDLEMPLELVDLSLLHKLDSLKPYGTGNPIPTFVSRNVGISSMDLVGKEKSHISFKFFSGGTVFKAIFFNQKDLYHKLAVGQRIDIVYNIELNEFNGSKNLNLILRDLKS